MNDIELEQRLTNRKNLLQSRKEEYAIFGKTIADSEYDQKIRDEISQLEAKLPHHTLS
jgi:NAD-dependent DNA ligase